MKPIVYEHVKKLCFWTFSIKINSIIYELQTLGTYDDQARTE